MVSPLELLAISFNNRRQNRWPRTRTDQRPPDEEIGQVGPQEDAVAMEKKSRFLHRGVPLLQMLLRSVVADVLLTWSSLSLRITRVRRRRRSQRCENGQIARKVMYRKTLNREICRAGRKKVIKHRSHSQAFPRRLTSSSRSFHSHATGPFDQQPVPSSITSSRFSTTPPERKE